MDILTYGTHCKAGHGIDLGERTSNMSTAQAKTVSAKPKPEKVNLRFKHIRVQIQNARDVVVREDGDQLIVQLSPIHNG